MSWRASAYIKALIVCPNGERVSRTEKLVALVLADSHQDKGNAFTFPALKTIADDSLMDPRVCRRVLASLERKGVIERERAENQGRGQTTFYRFPVLDGPAKGGHGVPLSGVAKDVEFLAKRRTEGGRKEDKTAPLLLEEQEQEQKQIQIPPPNPLVTEGEADASTVISISSGRKDGAAEEEIEKALDRVMAELGLTKRRDRRRLRIVIVLEARGGEDPPEIAERMLKSEKRQREARIRGELTSSYGVMNFFERGVWKHEGRWHWNEELLRLRAGAGVGS